MLKIRSIPFNLKHVLSADAFNFDSLAADFENGSTGLLIDLGLSMSLEVGEQLILYFNRKVGTYSTNGGNDFVTQEGRHSAAHRILNSRLIDNKYEPQKYLGTINRTSRQVFAPRAEMIVREFDLNPRNVSILKAFMRSTSCFEVLQGFLSASLAFQKLEKFGVERFEKQAPYYYLWFYHYAEEFEHLETTFEYYCETFSEDMWDQDHYAETMRELRDLINLSLHFSFAAAERLQKQFTVEQIVLDPFYLQREAMIKQLLVPGWSPAKSAQERAYFVEKWDNYFEPLMHKLVLKWAERHGVH